MCGIAGYKCFGSIRPQKDEVEKLLLGIMSRGKDATGIAWLENGSLQVYKAPVDASEFIKTDRWRALKLPPTLLLHTRAATKGSPKNNMNNHPIFNKDGMAITHNGMVINDDSLFATHRFKRDAEVDSEIILRLIEKGWWGDIEKLENLIGGFAVAAIYEKKPDELILFRHSNPIALRMDKDRDILFWASTKDIIKIALTKYHRGFLISSPFCYEMADDTAILIGKTGVVDVKKLNVEPRWKSWGYKQWQLGQHKKADIYDEFYGNEMEEEEIDKCPYCGSIITHINWEDGYCDFCNTNLNNFYKL